VEDYGSHLAGDYIVHCMSSGYTVCNCCLYFVHFQWLCSEIYITCYCCSS